MNTRVLLDFVEWRLGPDAVDHVLRDVGEQRMAAALRDDGTWSTYDQFRRLLEGAALRLGGPDALHGVGELPSLAGGTTPEVTTLLQAYGSPINMAIATSKPGSSYGDSLYPVMDTSVEVCGPTHLLIRHQLVDGFEPFPELCAYICGLAPLSIRLFGLRVHAVEEVTCRRRGDPECAVSVRWDETADLSLQLEFTALQLRLAEDRLASFQRTVADIVSADDLDTVLGRIVHAAAQTTSAAAHVLEVDSLAGRTRLYAEGVDEDGARNIVDRVSAAEAGYLAIDLVSSHRRHGRLIVVDPDLSLAFLRPALEGYARLAATALTSALALEEARRETERSVALLELSRSLAEVACADDLAVRFAEVMPSVIECDCSAVLLIDDGVARVAAHFGFDASMAAGIDALELAVERDRLRDVVVHTPGNAPPLAPFLEAMALQALATAPIAVDDTVVGLLVAGVHREPERLVSNPHLAERFAGLAGQAAVALRNARLNAQIRHQSLHDPLTDLPNRSLLLDRAEQMLSRVRRDRHACAAVFVDLDDFKEINDTLGHEAGDELLRIVAARLRTALRGSDTVGRLGGDEFVVLTEDASLDAGVETVAERLLDVLRQPVGLEVGDRSMVVHASMGIAVGDRATAGDLLRDADIALYRAKSAGKGCYRVFVPYVPARTLSSRASSHPPAALDPMKEPGLRSL